MSDSVRPHRQQPTRLPHPWDSPGKNTGVGCHFLLQCMKVKRESEVAQSCPTLSDPMDCSPPGSSVHGIFQAGLGLVNSATQQSTWRCKLLSHFCPAFFSISSPKANATPDSRMLSHSSHTGMILACREGLLLSVNCLLRERPSHDSFNRCPSHLVARIASDIRWSTNTGKSHGWRSLVGYSPWGLIESDMTERLLK